MIRCGYYCKYKRKIFSCGFLNNNIIILRSNDMEDVKKRGFLSNTNYKNTEDGFCGIHNSKLIKTVPIKKIKWFCRIGNSGYYKGFKVGIAAESENEYLINKDGVPIDSEIFSEENGFERIDRLVVSGKVPKSEVTNITEIKTPISKDYKAPNNWNF